MAVAQSILGTVCTHIELASLEVTPPDDDQEFFVVAWCLHPTFVPDETIIFIPKPNVCIPRNALYIDVEEIVLNRLPSLQCLVRLRIVEYQDWSTPPPSSDDRGLNMVDHVWMTLTTATSMVSIRALMATDQWVTGIERSG
jgi:hypothetical protein